jgi:methylmalonyl-CoA/ethylmalonyl-CoA epimerase
MNLTNAKIVQLLIPVDNFDKGMSFYRDVLGLPLLFAAPPQMAFFNCGGLRLLVGRYAARPEPAKGISNLL